MAVQVTPVQERYIDPYMQRIYDFNTVDAKVYLSRATNMLLKSIGDDIVLDGFDIKNPTISSDTIISVDVDPGLAIQDYTLCENLAGVGSVPKVTLSIDVAGLDDTTVGGAHIGVWISYQFLHTIIQNDFVLKMYHVPSSGFGMTPSGFSAPRCATLIGILCFTKDPVTGFVTDVWILPELIAGVPDYKNWPSLLAESVLFYLKGWKEHYPHIDLHDLVKFIGGYEGWVRGPETAIDDGIAVFDGISGKIIKMIDRNVRVIPDVTLGPGVKVPCDNVLGTDGLVYRCRNDHVATAANRPITGNVVDPETLLEEWTKYWDVNHDKTTADTWVLGTSYITNLDTIMNMTPGNSEIHIQKYGANIHPFSDYHSNFWSADRQYHPAIITGDQFSLGATRSYGYNFIHVGPPYSVSDNIEGVVLPTALMIWNHRTQEDWDILPQQYGIIVENQNYSDNPWVFPIGIQSWQTESGQSEVLGTDNIAYRCIQEHISDPTNRPFTGNTHIGPGTISNLAGDHHVVGVGTQFLTDFHYQHNIIIDGVNYLIAEVIDDENLTTGIASDWGVVSSYTSIPDLHTNVSYGVCDWNRYWSIGGGNGCNPWANGRLYRSRGQAKSFNIGLYSWALSYSDFSGGFLQAVSGTCTYHGGSYTNSIYGDGTGEKPCGWTSSRAAMAYIGRVQLYEDGWEGKSGTIPVLVGVSYGLYLPKIIGGAWTYSVWAKDQMLIEKDDVSYNGQLCSIYAKYNRANRKDQMQLGILVESRDQPVELITPANNSNFSYSPTNWTNIDLVEFAAHPGNLEVPPLPWTESFFRMTSSAAGQSGELSYLYAPTEKIVLVTGSDGSIYECLKPHTSTIDDNPITDQLILVTHNSMVYECLVSNLSTADNEPGVGINWETYWVEYTDPVVPPVTAPDWAIGINYYSYSPYWKLYTDPVISPATAPNWAPGIRYNVGGFTYRILFRVISLTLGSSWELRSGTQIIGTIDSLGYQNFTWTAFGDGGLTFVSNDISTMDIIQPISMKESNLVQGLGSCIALQGTAVDNIFSAQPIYGIIGTTNSSNQKGQNSCAIMGMSYWTGSRFVLGTNSSTVLGTDGKVYRCRMTHRSNDNFNQPINGSWWSEFWELDSNEVTAPVWAKNTTYTAYVYECVVSHYSDIDTQPISGINYSSYWVLDTDEYSTGNIWVDNVKYSDIGPVIVCGQQALVQIKQENGIACKNLGAGSTLTSFYANRISGGNKRYSYYGIDPLFIDRDTTNTTTIDAAVKADYRYPTREIAVQCGVLAQSYDIGGSSNYNSYGHIIGTLGVAVNTFNGKLVLYGVEGRVDNYGIYSNSWAIGVLGMANWYNQNLTTVSSSYYKTFTITDVDPSSDTITFADGHDKLDGDVVEFTADGSTIPGGLAVNTIYTVMNSTPTTIQVGTNVSGVLTVIDITSTGSGGPFKMFSGRKAPLIVYGVQADSNLYDTDNSEYSTNMENMNLNIAFAANKCLGGWMQYALKAYDPVWLGSGDYVVGTDSDVVTSSHGGVYICISNHKAGALFGVDEEPGSGSIFSEINWALYPGYVGTPPLWQIGRDYKCNTYICTHAHVSTVDNRPISGNVTRIDPIDGLLKEEWEFWWRKEYIYITVFENFSWVVGTSYRAGLHVVYTGHSVTQVAGNALAVNGSTLSVGTINSGWIKMYVNSNIVWVPYWKRAAGSGSGGPP